MNKKISKQEILEILKNIRHPAIDKTLLELGIIKSVNVENNVVKVLLAFPFPNIPIKDMLISSVQEPLREHNIKFNIETTVMSEEERFRFLTMEQEAWRNNFPL